VGKNAALIGWLVSFITPCRVNLIPLATGVIQIVSIKGLTCLASPSALKMIKMGKIHALVLKLKQFAASAEAVIAVLVLASLTPV